MKADPTGATVRRVEPRSSDESLVARCSAGDLEAFESIVRRHQRGVANHLYRLVGKRDAAMDLAQEVFLKVYQSIETFDPRYRFSTWLYRIASNSAIDHLRKRRIPTCSLTADDSDDGRSAPDDHIAGSSPDPHDVLRYRELESRIEAALARLPTEYRELILLRHRQHCRYDEMARITGLPIGTVKNRIFRARDMLRRQLGDVLDTVEA